MEDKGGALVNVWVWAQVLEVVVPKAREKAEGEEPRTENAWDRERG